MIPKTQIGAQRHGGSELRFVCWILTGFSLCARPSEAHPAIVGWRQRDDPIAGLRARIKTVEKPELVYWNDVSLAAFDWRVSAESCQWAQTGYLYWKNFGPLLGVETFVFAEYDADPTKAELYGDDTGEDQGYPVAGENWSYRIEQDEDRELYFFWEKHGDAHSGDHWFHINGGDWQGGTTSFFGEAKYIDLPMVGTVSCHVTFSQLGYQDEPYGSWNGASGIFPTDWRNDNDHQTTGWGTSFVENVSIDIWDKERN